MEATVSQRLSTGVEQRGPVPRRSGWARGFRSRGKPAVARACRTAGPGGRKDGFLQQLSAEGGQQSSSHWGSAGRGSL